MKVSGSEIVYFMLIFNLVLLVVPQIEIVPGVTLQVGQLYQFITFNPYNNLMDLMAQTELIVKEGMRAVSGSASCTFMRIDSSAWPIALVTAITHIPISININGVGPFCLLLNIGTFIGLAANIFLNIVLLALMVLLFSTIGSTYLYFQIFSIIDPQLGLVLGVLLGTIQTIYVLCTLLVDGMKIMSGVAKFV